MTKYRIISIITFIVSLLIFAHAMWLTPTIVHGNSSGYYGNMSQLQIIAECIAWIFGGYGGFMILPMVASGYGLFSEQNGYLTGGMAVGIAALVIAVIVLASSFFIKDESGLRALGVYAEFAFYVTIGLWLIITGLISKGLSKRIFRVKR